MHHQRGPPVGVPLSRSPEINWLFFLFPKYRNYVFLCSLFPCLCCPVPLKSWPLLLSFIEKNALLTMFSKILWRASTNNDQHGRTANLYVLSNRHYYLNTAKSGFTCVFLFLFRFFFFVFFFVFCNILVHVG